MVIEPQFFIPGDAKAEASEPLSTPINNDPRRMAGIDETDKASPYNPLRSRATGKLPPTAKGRRVARMLQELQALHAARDASPKDYGKYRQPPFDGTFGNQELVK
jgi:hypothetical protein